MALVHEIGEYVSGARLSVDFLLRSTAQLCFSVMLKKLCFSVAYNGVVKETTQRETF
jgi:hypothetical protein